MLQVEAREVTECGVRRINLLHARTREAGGSKSWHECGAATRCEHRILDICLIQVRMVEVGPGTEGSPGDPSTRRNEIRLIEVGELQVEAREVCMGQVLSGTVGEMRTRRMENDSALVDDLGTRGLPGPRADLRPG